MLEVNNIEVTYNKVSVALRGISLFVPESKIIALLGTNGSGKTTTIKSILGLLKTEEGEIENGNIHFLEKQIDGLDTDTIVKMGIALVPEGRRIFINLSVEKNLRVGAYTRKNNKRAMAINMETVFKIFPLLVARRKMMAGYLSGGEQQMLALGRALMTDPVLLILDEPSLGLAPLVTNEIFQKLSDINRSQEAAILLVEQNANIALSMAEYGYILENGKIVMDGESKRLRDNEDVREFYLGVTEGSRRKNYSNVKHYKRRKRWLS
ncbi:MAG: ABC transporter ATP-binding protein [Thermodesulfobacteriota bacterium]|nr:ABC transporter ATP-binding protein [Thermodesulfobacteriota bacterium]